MTDILPTDGADQSERLEQLARALWLTDPKEVRPAEQFVKECWAALHEESKWWEHDGQQYCKLGKNDYRCRAATILSLVSRWRNEELERVRQAALNECWRSADALGGSFDPGDMHAVGYAAALREVTIEIEKLGGKWS